MTGDLGARLLHANTGPKVDPQLQRGLARLGKSLGGDDGADANVDSQELVEIDWCGRRRTGVVYEVHCVSLRHLAGRPATCTVTVLRRQALHPSKSFATLPRA